jgi:hypothetical protein
MKRTMTVLLLAFVAGCTSYHKVTDLNTGKVYYTKDLERKGSGSVQLKDGRTGATVVLPYSEAQKIKEDDYKRGIYSSQG